MKARRKQRAKAQAQAQQQQQQLSEVKEKTKATPSPMLVEEIERMVVQKRKDREIERLELEAAQMDTAARLADAECKLAELNKQRESLYSLLKTVGAAEIAAEREKQAAAAAAAAVAAAAAAAALRPRSLVGKA